VTLFYEDELQSAPVDIVDLFAGCGGWSEGLRRLGLTDVGIEFDRWACATRRAAGFHTIEADVSHVDPLDFRGASGLIASPPCQAFSSAGSKHGRKALAELTKAVAASDWTARPHKDPRVWLALEVGRWWESLLPEWVALEQVTAALPLWEEYALVFEAAGWSAWCGVVDAADLGAPQHRRRAILLAHANYLMAAPRPTVDPPSMARAIGWPDGVQLLVSTGRNWNAADGTSQVVDCTHAPAPTLTAQSGGQWHLGVDRAAPRRTPGARALSIAEALAIQTFPTDYPVRGNRSQVMTQIGNAVPPLMAERLLAGIAAAGTSSPADPSTPARTPSTTARPHADGVVLPHTCRTAARPGDPSGDQLGVGDASVKSVGLDAAQGCRGLVELQAESGEVGAPALHRVVDGVGLVGGCGVLGAVVALHVDDSTTNDRDCQPQIGAAT
jgi:DNA (cytosine-5)-methyltransferase 1